MVTMPFFVVVVFFFFFLLFFNTWMLLSLSQKDVITMMEWQLQWRSDISRGHTHSDVLLTLVSRHSRQPSTEPSRVRSRYAHRFSELLPSLAPVIYGEHLMRPPRPHNYTPSSRCQPPKQVKCLPDDRFLRLVAHRLKATFTQISGVLCQ